MPIVIKPIATLQEKFVRRASGAGADYKAGVMAPRRPQAESAIAAAPTWAAALQQAIADGRFARGLQKAGDQKWQSHAAGKGAVRYPAGVADAGPAWASGFAPIRDALSSITFTTARGPKGSPENYQRSQQVGNVEHAIKLAAGK